MQEERSAGEGPSCGTLEALRARRLFFKWPLHRGRDRRETRAEFNGKMEKAELVWEN